MFNTVVKNIAAVFVFAKKKISFFCKLILLLKIVIS